MMSFCEILLISPYRPLSVTNDVPQASMKTTIRNDNTTPLDKITDRATPEWVRTIIANRLATTGEEWVTFFKRDNNGT